MAQNGRPRVVVVNNFGIHPPHYGGPAATFAIFRELARYATVEIVTLGESPADDLLVELAPGLWERRIAKSPVHLEHERRISQAAGLNVSDIVLHELVRFTPRYGEELRRALSAADAAVVNHPYLYPALREYWDGPVYYLAHNVESLMKSAMLPQSPLRDDLMRRVVALEGAALAGSRLVFLLSPDDGPTFAARFGTDLAKCRVARPPVDPARGSYRTALERRSAKERSGLGTAPLVVFIGSAHRPNIDAALVVLRLAAALPVCTFVIVGNVANVFSGTPPANVRFTRELAEAQKNALVGLADVALNPSAVTSGLNMKMFDYFLAGVPVISTPAGARGFAVRDGEHLLLAEIDRFAEAIACVVADPTAAEERARRAYRHVLALFEPSVAIDALVGAVAEDALSA
jgi:glycosyltransferase involved in cell wall biosynthesis